MLLKNQGGNRAFDAFIPQNHKTLVLTCYQEN